MPRKPGDAVDLRLGRRRAVVFAMVGVIPLLVGVMGWRSIDEARDAVTGQVESTQVLAAEARAGDLAASMDAAEDQLMAFAASEAVADAVAGGRLDVLEEQLGTVLAMRGAVGAAARLTAGDGVTVGAEPPPDVTTERSFRSVEDRTSARLTLVVPVTARDGSAPGRVGVELDLGLLSPQLVQPFEEFQGRTSLIGRDGTVVMSSPAPPSGRVEAEPLLEVLQAGVRGIVAYDSSQLGGHRIAAVVPVHGTDLMVVVGVDDDVARAPVAGLERRLVVLVGLTVVLVLLLLVAAVATVRGGRRELETAERRASRLAHTDPLTGLPNRRAFDEALLDARGQVAVVVADIDRLKVINDELGHAAGDEALRAAAEAITSAIRPGDVAARVGGDEFAVLLPGSSSSIAEEVGERIRHAVRQAGVASDRPLSASVGVAAGAANETAGLLLGADAALYAAKATRGDA